MLFPTCVSKLLYFDVTKPCQTETEATESLVQQRLLARLQESSPKSPEEKAADVEAAAKIAMVSRSVSPSSSHSSPQHRPNSHSNSPNVLRNELTEREKYIEEARFFGIHNNHRQSNMAPDKEDMYILHELSHANRYAADSPFFRQNVPPPPMAPSTPPVSNISKQTVSTLQSMINISKQQPSVADVSTLPPPSLPPPPLPRPPSPPPPPQPFFNEKALPRASGRSGNLQQTLRGFDLIGETILPKAQLRLGL